MSDKKPFTMYVCGCRHPDPVFKLPPEFCPVHGERAVIVEPVPDDEAEDGD